ncbi:3 beta-hydroxysteroid dehydrogenase/Delta 5--_4-isomerase [compost metagenome]
MMKFFITGANGFVGGRLVKILSQDADSEVVAAVRTLPESQVVKVDYQVTDYTSFDKLSVQLHGVDCVVHAAARVHVMNEAAVDPLEAFRKVNVEGTLRLAKAASLAGVKRFIFISSIKVNGESTLPGQPYTADAIPAPVDPYGISKEEAERGLRALERESALEVVIIRPVLVYGPGVKANFRSMMNWLYKRVPLPFGAIDNRRSLVFVDNLVDLIKVCTVHPGAAGHTFLASDGDDISTTQLLRKIALALGVRPMLLGIPTWVLRLVASSLGKKSISQRLCGSLQVDIRKNQRLLNWTPPIPVDAALQITAQDFKERLKK